MYELIDHTADIGIRVQGSSLKDLFIKTAEALFDISISSKRPSIPAIDVPIAIEADSVDQLLVRWLQELLYIFETRHLVLVNFWIDEIDERHLLGLAKGNKFDSTRHSQKIDIKAVTYHQLEVVKDEDGKWYAKVIFDI